MTSAANHSLSPALLITIDTECDNGWIRPKTLTTENSRYLPRFQRLCERYGLRPTWLTNHEMARCPVFQEFGRDVLARDAGEIGMHLHAWSSPPHVALTDNDMQHYPYLIEYGTDVMREKIRMMTELLEEVFGRKMRSHRAGRWSLDSRYARLLVEHGYRVDCSVTPHVSWRRHLGDPRGRGGVDYTWFPSEPYYLDLDAIDRAGDSALLELPMSIVPARLAGVKRIAAHGGTIVRRLAGRLARRVVWFRPDGTNRESMRRMVRLARDGQWPYLQFMLHSTELMPGGSPTFPDESSIDTLYDDLESVFAEAATDFHGATLTEFHNAWTQPKNARGRRWQPDTRNLVSSQSGTAISNAFV